MLAIFASGTGTTLQTLMDCQERYNYQVSLVVTNRVCLAQERAEQAGVTTLLSKDWQEIDQALIRHHIQLIVLAGFLAIIPQWFCEKWDKKIINIHKNLRKCVAGDLVIQDSIQNTLRNLFIKLITSHKSA